MTWFFYFRKQTALLSAIVRDGAIIFTSTRGKNGESGVDSVMRNELQNQVQSFDSS